MASGHWRVTAVSYAGASTSPGAAGFRYRMARRQRVAWEWRSPASWACTEVALSCEPGVRAAVRKLAGPPKNPAGPSGAFR